MAHEFDGHKYARAAAAQQEWGTRLIADLQLRGDEHVLDLGCGDGSLTEPIARLVPRGRVLGIDPSRGMIDAAAARQRPNLRFERLDVAALDATARFDVVFSNAALHWIHDHAALVDRVHRALRPGGRLRASFGGDGNCPNLQRVLRRTMADDRFAPAFAGFGWPWRFPSVDEMRPLVAARFDDVRVWSENADRLFPDAGALTGWIEQPCLVPFVAWLPEAERPAFRDAVVDAMVAACRQADGRCLEIFRRLNVDARRRN